MSTFLVVLAGGNGTRLWPLSRASKPKQFLSFCPHGTLLQKAIKRNQVAPGQKTILLTGLDHIALVEEQLEEINILNIPIIIEPYVKNTAPAIIAAGLKIYNENPEAIMIVTPSDNAIDQIDEYQKCITAAVELARQGYYATLAVKPRRAETAYGYIKQGSRIGDQAFVVDKFFEKPNLKKAKEYINSGDYFWNSGIFVFPVKRFLAEVAVLEPTMLQYIRDAFEKAITQENKIFLDKDTYGQIHANSIDYALMEKASKVAAVKAEFSWSDMGTLRSIWETTPKDVNGNVLSNNSLTFNTKNVFINSSSHRVIAAVDIEGVSIIETPDVLLVANSNSTNSIKQVVEELNRTRNNDHDIVIEPWGTSELLTKGEHFFIKKIKVKPGKSISLNTDPSCSQHYIVVKGIAELRNGDKAKVYKSNDYIPVSPANLYSIVNLGSDRLELLEVKSGNTAQTIATDTDDTLSA